MTQKTILPINGVMNQDSAPSYVKEGEVYERRNARVVTIDGKIGHNTSLKGTMSVNSYIGHKALCSVEDIKRSRLLFFLKDTISNNDKIIAVSKDNTTTTLYASSVFNFNINYPIEADVISDWLVWTDNYNPPRKLNISDVLATIDEYNIQLAVRQPKQAPTVLIGSDSTRKVNLLLGRTFQFAHQYIYKGYEYSTLSAYSQLAVPPSVFYTSNQTYVDDSIGNYVVVTFDYGTSDVLKVRLLAREGNTGDWFIVDEYDRGNVDDYTPISISFYNDKARQQLSSSEALTFFSDVPLKASSVVTVKNRVGLAGVTKGYDKTNVSTAYEVEYGAVSLSVSSTSFTIGHEPNSEQTGMLIYADLPASFTTDSVVTILIDGRIVQFSENASNGYRIIDYAFYYSYSHIVVAGETKDDILNLIVADINTKGQSILSTVFAQLDAIVVAGVKNVSGHDIAIEFLNGYSPLYYASTAPEELAGGYLTEKFETNGSVSITPSNSVTFKSGSYYNVGMLYYDLYGRTSGVLSSTKVYIPSNGERTYADAYKQSKIKFTIGDEIPPSWAKYYRFAVSESANIVSVVPFVSGYGISNRIFDTYEDNTPVFAIQLPLNVDYEFIKGDYVILEKDSGSAISTIVKTIIGTKVEIKYSGNTYTGLFLIVPKASNIIADFEGKVSYIVRPKSEVKETIYYEDYNTYNIVNGELSTKEGYIINGDAWFTERTYQWDMLNSPATKIVEDFYISVDNGIRVFSKGRAVVDFGDLGVQKELQHFVWSKQYLTNTKINGLAFFESTSRVELEEKNGRITSVKLIGDILKVIQPNKETSLYVGKQQVTNADGTLTLTATANFIGTVYPLAGTSGSVHKKSVATNNNYIYYWDEGRGEVVRSGNNGQQSINIGMNSYFKAVKKTLDSATWTNIVFHYDDRYNELICSFSWLNGAYNTSVIVFSELMQGWSYFYDLNYGLNGVDIFGSIGEKNYAFNSGLLHELDANAAYNTFFNSVKAFSISSYANIYPSQEKVLKSLLLDSNKGLATTVESDVANTRPYGHYTVLVSGSYRNREGLYASTINRNIRVANGATNSSLLYSGDLMTGKWFKIGLSTSDSTLTELKFIHVGYNGSN